MAEPLGKSDLWKLYELAINDEYMYIKENQNRTVLYSGLVMTILGASIAGAVQMTDWTQCLLLICGPICAVAVAQIAKESASRFYNRFLEAVSVQAKV